MRDLVNPQHRGEKDPFGKSSRDDRLKSTEKGKFSLIKKKKNIKKDSLGNEPPKCKHNGP